MLVYKGGWKADYPNMFQDDFIEVGQFANFEFQNLFGGDLDWAWDNCGNVYFGQTDHQNQFEGKGVCRYSLGYVYRGFFKEGTWNNHGELYGDYGKIYSGQFFRASFEGKGTLLFPDGRKYIGGFHKGHMHGPGKLLFPDGQMTSGTFVESQLEGQASITFADLSNLECTFRRGLKQGRAVYVARQNHQERFFLRIYQDDKLVHEIPKSKKPKLKKSFCCFF